jgi:hypothetical protein
MRIGSRLAATTVVVAGLAGAGAVTASAGQAAAPPTREAALAAALQCRHVPQAIEFTGSVRITATLPESVTPGARVPVQANVTVTADPAAGATPVSVTLFGPTPERGEQSFMTLPANESSTLTLQAGISGTIKLTLGIPTPVTMRMGGLNVGCFPVGPVSGELSIPIVAPGDGSQQSFDVRATATCTDERGTRTHEFGMTGVAPSSVRPGEPVGITFNWRGLASQLQDTGTFTISGTVSGPREVNFSGINGSRGHHVTTGPAGPSGEVRVQLDRVASALQVLNPPYAYSAQCSFPTGGPVVTVPIRPSSPPVTASSTTTTTIRDPHTTLALLLKRMLCALFRIC